MRIIKPPQYIFSVHLLQLEFCSRLKMTAESDASDLIEILIGRMHIDMKEKSTSTVNISNFKIMFIFELFRSRTIGRTKI